MSKPLIDCSKLLVDFTSAPKGIRLAEYFSSLAAYPEFSRQQDENVIKVAILTSDSESPFWKLRGDRVAMITAIFEFLEIGTLNQKGKKFFKDVLEYKHEEVGACWSAYLQMQFYVDFTDWALTKQTYDMLISESTRQKEDDETMSKFADWRVKIRGQIRQLGDDLKKIEPLVFKDSKMAQPVAIAQIKKIKGYTEKYGRKFEGFNA